jgi:hypothetical protein
MESFNIANGDGNSQKTRKIEHQVASSVGGYIKSDHEEIIRSNYFTFRGENVVEIFCNWIINYEKFYLKYRRLTQYIFHLSF